MIGDERMRAVASLPRLQHLELGACKLSAADVTILSALTALTCLRLSYDTPEDTTGMGNASACALAQLSNLQSLTLGRVGQQGAVAIAVLTGLTHFTACCA